MIFIGGDAKMIVGNEDTSGSYALVHVVCISSKIFKKTTIKILFLYLPFIPLYNYVTHSNTLKIY